MATRDRMQACLRVGSSAFALSMGVLCTTASAQSRYGIGHAATPAQVAAWNLDVSPDGRNLPAGQGSVLRGREVFANQCAACHGARGEGGSLGDKLAGGQGTLATPTPVRTVGSYWPYATTLFDYVRRAMPLNAPQSLSNEDVYAVSGYVLFLNGLVAEDTVVNAKTLTELKMPNRDGFVSDPRPDVRNTGCLRDCIK
jgi:mono/diheme cytochrome c family protein